MTADFHRTIARKKAISVMLLLAFLSMTLFPQHYHMHAKHDADFSGHDSHSHAHVEAVHAHAGANDISHHADGHIIESGGDTPLNAQGFQLPWFGLLMLVALLLPVFSRAGSWQPLDESRRLVRSSRHNIPPLRAPPRI